VLMAAEHRIRGMVWERSGEHGTVQALTALLNECFGSAINLATRRHGGGRKPAERGQSFKRRQNKVHPDKLKMLNFYTLILRSQNNEKGMVTKLQRCSDTGPKQIYICSR
jgi:hypothetical protein